MDEQQKVRTISALAIAALAEAATPYGIESFDSVLKPLWKGIRQHRGKVSIIFGKWGGGVIARSTPSTEPARGCGVNICLLKCLLAGAAAVS